MVIQLSLVGIYLEYIFKWNLWYVNVLYVFVMMSLAAFSIIKSVQLPFKKLLVPIFLAIMIPTLFMLFYFNLLVVQAEYTFDAKYVIPIGGMILGNVLSGIIVGLNSFYKGIAAAEKTYQYNLALGATLVQARAPYFREAVYATINPTVASMATIGLIALPGMMTGQILGGSEPFVAIKYQIAIMLI
jgi:putative ABC transport system permease protein